jgi:hypothetical protein
MLFYYMKRRLNITIDKELIEDAKLYAKEENKSLSQLIEEILKKLVIPSPPGTQNILEVLQKLPKLKSDSNQTTWESYYEERKGKYGF